MGIGDKELGATDTIAISVSGRFRAYGICFIAAVSLGQGQRKDGLADGYAGQVFLLLGLGAGFQD